MTSANPPVPFGPNAAQLENERIMSPPSDNRFQIFKDLCDTVRREEPKRLEREQPVLIFGAGQFGQAVCNALRAEGFDVQGFIESTPREDRILGLPVHSWRTLQFDQTRAQLAVGIFNRFAPMDELHAMARTAGFSAIFLPWDLYEHLGGRLGWRFWLSARNVILDNLTSIERTWSTLADHNSRECFLRILEFRLGKNLAHGSFTNKEHHYFNEMTLPPLVGKTVNYVDGGAYSGDTFLELTDHADISCAWLFEPDQDNFGKLIRRTRETGTRTVCLPLALSDHYQILSFSAGHGEGSAISEHGTVNIATAALDQVLSGERIDFIKLDIEGAELAALHGSVDTISRFRPVLAISLYHRAEDLWEIPELVRSICQNYRFHIRQHCHNSFDTVLYATPDLS